MLVALLFCQSLFNVRCLQDYLKVVIKVLNNSTTLDTNECQEDPLVCGVGSCQNMDGSFKCYCPDGYSSADERSCQGLCEE